MKMFSKPLKCTSKEGAYSLSRILAIIKLSVATGAMSFSFVFNPANSQTIVNSATPPSPNYATPSTPSFWLILFYQDGTANSLDKVQMQTMEQCELQGAIWKSSKRMTYRGGSTAFECLEGK